MNSTEQGKGDININPQFVLAGEAVFTVSNGVGEHRTFKVYSSPPTVAHPNPAWFVEVKAGPEEDDWRYIGRLVVNPENGKRDPELVLTAKSAYNKSTAAYKIAAWALKVVWQMARGDYRLPPGYSIKHEGRCGRCSRLLRTQPRLTAASDPNAQQHWGSSGQNGTGSNRNYRRRTDGGNDVSGGTDGDE